MAHCTTCGMPRSSPSSFCTACGASPGQPASRVARHLPSAYDVDAAQHAPAFCTSCGEACGPDAAGCTRCGAPITRSPKAWTLRRSLRATRLDGEQAAATWLDGVATSPNSTSASFGHQHRLDGSSATGARVVLSRLPRVIYASRAVAVLIALAFIIVSTGQGEEIKQSLDSLSVAGVWLVFAAVLYWALQSWLWSAVAIRASLLSSLRADPKAQSSAPLAVEKNALAVLDRQLTLWLPVAYALFVLAIGAWQFTAAGRDGLAFLLASTSLIIVVLIRFAWPSQSLEAHAAARASTSASMTPASNDSWLARILHRAVTRVRMSSPAQHLSAASAVAILVSAASALVLLSVGAVDPVWLGQTLNTLGVVFLAFGIYTPPASALVIATRNTRIPTVLMLLVTPFLMHLLHGVLVANIWLVLAIAAIAIFSLRTPASVVLAVLAIAFVSVLPFWSTARPHEIRRLAQSDADAEACGSPSFAACKPSVADALNAWLDNTPPVAGAPESSAAGQSRHIVFVSAAGGGLRAAYWTAAVLARIDDCVPDFSKSVFSISGVSGGSLGAAVYAALLADRGSAPRAFNCARDAQHLTSARQLPGGLQQRAASMLGQDFLAPVASSMLFRDLLQAMVPVVLVPDRAAALEVGFERGWRESCARRAYGEECSAPDALSADFMDLQKGPAWRPTLLLNGTHLETGKRIVTSHIAVTSDIFLDTLDFHDIASFNVRVSTAVANSARFPVVSPSGAIIEHTADGMIHRGHIIDGGYFENNGAVTTLDLARRALCGSSLDCEKRSPQARGLAPIFIDIVNDTDAIEEDEPEERGPELVDVTKPFFPLGRDRVVPILNQLAAPIQGLDRTRSARGVHASRELAAFARSIGARYVRVRLCPGMKPSPQLGWLLSDGSRAAMDALILGHTDASRALQFGTVAEVKADVRADAYVSCSQDVALKLNGLMTELAQPPAKSAAPEDAAVTATEPVHGGAP